MAERLGISGDELIRIASSSSETDETIIPFEGVIQAKVGPAEDAEPIALDAQKFSWENLINEDGYYRVTATARSEPKISVIVYIAKP